MKIIKLFNTGLLVATICLGQMTFAQSKMTKDNTKMVGGAAMYPTKTL